MGHEGNNIWVCEHFNLKSDLQILLPLWLSEHCYIPNISSHGYIFFVITTRSRGCSSTSKGLCALLPSTCDLLQCFHVSLVPQLISGLGPSARTSEKKKISNLVLIERWDFNKIILWDKCLLPLNRLLILWKVKNVKTADLGYSQSTYFRFFYKKVQVLLWEREMQIWWVLMAL